MQVEIKKVEIISSTYQGKTKYKKAVTMPTETLNVSETNKCYPDIQEGYEGMAEITFGDFEGRRYIKTFKPLGDMPKIPEKAHTGQNKPTNGNFVVAKKDPEGIKLDVWRRQHTSWIGCLNNAVVLCNAADASNNFNVIETTNQFYDALCKKVDKLATKSESNNNDINNGNIKNVADKHGIKEQVTSRNDAVDIADVPF